MMLGVGQPKSAPREHGSDRQQVPAALQSPHHPPPPPPPPGINQPSEPASPDGSHFLFHLI